MTDQPPTNVIPPLRSRVLQLVAIGYVIAAIRLGLDFWDQDRAMWFGLFYAMPVAILVIGRRRSWGPIPWTSMAKTMVIVGVLVWGVCNSISYSVGQFMEWTDGRYYPGELKPDGTWADGKWPDGEERGIRATFVKDTTMGKIGAGLLHGLLSSILGSIWCILAGTLFCWVPRRTLRTGSGSDSS